MAILAREPDSFPPDLMSGEPCSADEAVGWKVLHTRPRAEKMVARKLRRMEIRYYFPQYERKYRQQRRMIRSYLPLFPGYLFVESAKDQWAVPEISSQVANVLEVSDQSAFERELKSIAALLSSGAEVAPENRLEAGDRAEIVGGPFKGREGTILRKGARLRLLVAVDFLQQGVSVEVDSGDLRWIAPK